MVSLPSRRCRHHPLQPKTCLACRFFLGELREQRERLSEGAGDRANVTGHTAAPQPAPVAYNEFPPGF